MKRLLIPAALAAVPIAAPAQAQGQVHIAPVIGLDHVRQDGRNMTGVAKGIQAGYDIGLPLGPRVGLEGEASWSSADRCDAGAFAPGDRLCTSAGRDLYVGGRAGVNLAGTFLYGKLGYANARIREEYTPAGSATGFATGRNHGGLRLGAGLEFSPPILPVFVRGEYRHTAYGDDLSRHQALVGAGVRF